MNGVFAEKRKSASRARAGARPVEKRAAPPAKENKKAEARREVWRSRLECVRETILLTACLLAIFYGALFFTRSPVFAVTNVQVFGARVLEREDLRQTVEAMRGKNIFMADLSAVARDLHRHPWVQGVTVERKMPHAIHINLEERSAFARVQLDKLYVIDNHGIVLGEDDGRRGHLPLLRELRAESVKPGEALPLTHIPSALRVLHYLNLSPLFSEDTVAEVDLRNTRRAVFITRSGKSRVFVDLETVQDGFANLRAALGLIRQKIGDFEYIDLSVNEQVIVKPAGNQDARPSRRL